MIEFRMRTKVTPEELETKKGRVLTDADYNVLLTRASRVLRPDGKPLCVYLPGAVSSEMGAAYPTLHKIRMKSDNRGLASGTKRVNAGGNRTRAMPVMSSVMGAMDPSPQRPVCRLTSYTREHVEAWEGTFPLLRSVAGHFAHHVPERYAAQMQEVERSRPEWVVPGTPFTTITVNNTYSTGVHTDAGDLDKGYSCLAVARRGEWQGGRLCFPEYRLAVDMRDGDLVLMDAHEWHGNTTMVCRCGNVLLAGPCESCGAERISVVCYFRSNVVQCGSATEEEQKRIAHVERRLAATG